MLKLHEVTKGGSLNMAMTRNERVLKQFTREPVDYLPSQITLADRTRDKEISEALGLDSPEELDEYLDNHIAFTYVKDDIPLFWRNDLDLMGQLEEEGYARVGLENRTVYDRWGMGVLIGNDGFFTNYGPFYEDEAIREKGRPYLPEHIQRLLSLPLEQAIKEYEFPDPLSDGNLDWYIRDKDGVPGGQCVIPSGYFGTYERAYALCGYEHFMFLMADQPDLVYLLMEKITDYRVKLAKVKADLGFKIVHHGDDLATQVGGFFSKEMFE